MYVLFNKLKREIIRLYSQCLNRIVEIKRIFNKFETIEVSDEEFKVTPHEFWREFRRDGWERETYDNFRRNITEETTFLDLGAWVGICSMWASVIGCKKIYAIEANPKSYELLTKTINANRSLRELITLTNQCISNVNGDIVKFGKKLSSNSMISKEGHYEVTTITLTKYINDIGSLDNVFLKIDIEGAEELIIKDFSILKDLIKDLKIFLALHPSFWKNKKLTCSELLNVCKDFKLSHPSGENLSVSRLKEMIMTDQDFPEWGTPYGNLFEIMLSNNH